MRRFLVLAVVTGVVALLAAPASALTIRTRQGRISQLGPFVPREDARLGAAIDAYGPPTAKARTSDGLACHVFWWKFQLRIIFSNFGGTDPCSRRGGFAQSALIGTDKAWQTDRGLRVGNRIRRIKRLYPHATRHGRRWWLERARSPFSGFYWYTVLAARGYNNRLTGFSGWIGGAGD
jgi:hypothetical protein